MPSRLGHGLYKKIDHLKNIFRCIYITTSNPIQVIQIATSNSKEKQKPIVLKLKT